MLVLAGWNWGGAPDMHSFMFDHVQAMAEQMGKMSTALSRLSLRCGEAWLISGGEFGVGGIRLSFFWALDLLHKEVSS